MERKQIVKLCVSGVVLAMSVPYVCGVFSGGDLTYELPKINRKVQDGTYVAQKTNNFSTVQVDMTISDLLNPVTRIHNLLDKVNKAEK